MPAVDLLTAAVAVIFFALLAAVVIEDVRRLRIPNAVSLALLALYPIHVLSAAQPIAWLPALAVTAPVFAAGLVLFATGRVGGGDVKLLTVIALWAGPALIVETLLYTGVIGGVMAVIMLSPLRFAIACASDALRLPCLRTRVLGRDLPYGVAIAGAAALTIGSRLLPPL